MTPNNKSFLGVDQVYYALVTQDDSSAYAAGTPAYLAPVMNISAAPKVNAKTQYADNQPYDVMASEGETELEVEVTGITPAVQAEILGKVFDAVNGRVMEGGAVAPYVALGFRAKKSDGAYRYYWFYKCQFQPPTEEAASETDTPDPKSVKLKLNAIRTIHQWALSGSVTDSAKRVWGDTGDAAFDPTNWFAAVQAPTVGAIPALTCTPSPADGATGVSVNVAPTLTFSNALAAGSELRVVITKNDGAIVSATVTINAARKVITVTPGSALGAATKYLITLAGLVDVFGQSFAKTVYDFTTT